MDVRSPLSQKVLRQRLDKLLANQAIKRPVDALATAIPIAFPITSAVFCVRERQVVQTGLIERYVIQAVQEFGAITAGEIEAMLGLEEEIVRRILQEAIAMGQPITCRRGRYLAPQTVDASTFSGEATQERRFIFSGVTGDLLPIAYGQIADVERLFPREEGCVVRDLDGNRAPVHAFLQHGIHDENSCLLRAVSEVPSKQKAVLGLPHEIIDVGEQDFTRRETLWVPAFLFIDTAGRAEIRGMHRDHALLLDGHRASLEWLDQSCIRRISFSIEADLGAFRSEVTKALPGIQVDVTDRVNRVRLHGDKQAWQPEQFFTPNTTVSGLVIALTRGYWWNPHRGELLCLTPGCPHAAKALCLLRAIGQLYRLRNRWDSMEAFGQGRSAWWRDHVEQFREELDEDLQQIDVSVQEFDRCIDRYPDTSLQEWYEEWE